VKEIAAGAEQLKENEMRELKAISGRALLALVCSLLLAFETPYAASNTGGIASGSNPSINQPEELVATAALPILTPEGASVSSDSIAVAKLSGTADRNGQPLINGSIVASGDSVSTHGGSALLLTSTPQERLWLGPNTSAKLTKDAGNVDVVLVQGTLSFQTRGHLQIVFENHDGLSIRSRADSLAVAELSLVNHQEVKVQVQEGYLELVQGGHSMLLQPEKSVPNLASGTPSSGQQAKAADIAGMGSLDGTVVDPKLFAVSGASITLTDAAGKTFKTESSHEGKFSFSSIPVGSYTLLVTQAGLQNYELKNVVVRSGNASSLYVQMGSTGVAKKDNHILIWVLVAGGIAGGIGAAVAAKGSSSSSTSPSTP
jgi:hypothetical protein